MDNGKLVIERLVGEISHAKLIEHKKQQLNNTSLENICIRPMRDYCLELSKIKVLKMLDLQTKSAMKLV